MSQENVEIVRDAWRAFIGSGASMALLGVLRAEDLVSSRSNFRKRPTAPPARGKGGDTS